MEDAFGKAPGPGDFPEDAHLENGQYHCLCCQCGQSFIGYKRRVTCRACEHEEALLDFKTPDWVNALAFGALIVFLVSLAASCEPAWAAGPILTGEDGYGRSVVLTDEPCAERRWQVAQIGGRQGCWTASNTSHYLIREADGAMRAISSRGFEATPYYLENYWPELQERARAAQGDDDE